MRMRDKMNNSQALEQAILKLRVRKNNEFRVLKAQVDTSYLELKPSRILKRIYADIKSEPEIKNNVIESVLSLAGGYVSKRLLIGKSNSLIETIMGYLVQIGATKIISDKILTNEKQFRNES